MIPFFALDRQYDQVGEECLHHTDLILRSGKFMDGVYANSLEQWLKIRTGASCVVLVHSGTQALELLAYALKPTNQFEKPRVLIPNLTFVATANAFIKAGYNIILGDVNDIGIMKPYDSKKENYYLSCGVGLYGAASHSEDVIDGAQSWLNGYMNNDFMTVSFDPTKNLPATANGGAILLNDTVTAETIRRMRDNNKGMRFQLDFGLPATNSKMSEIDCAQMMIKTRYIDAWQKRRSEIANHWIERLKNTGIRTLIDDTNFSTHCYHKFVIELDSRDIVQRNLAIRKIETKVHYAEPLHELPAYRNLAGPDLLSPASSLSRRCLSLPIYPELTDLEVEYIMDQLLDSFS